MKNFKAKNKIVIGTPPPPKKKCLIKKKPYKVKYNLKHCVLSSTIEIYSWHSFVFDIRPIQKKCKCQRNMNLL